MSRWCSFLATVATTLLLAMVDEREAWDAEVDMTYEAWGSALADGTQVYILTLSLFEDIRSTIRVGFVDTMSVRAGGALSIPFAGGVLSLRAVAYHDTPATKPENTRLLFDMLAKTGFTAGVGLKSGAFTINLALAKVFHETRELKTGAVRPINGSKGGQSVNGDDVPYAPVNEGVYAASTFAFALELTVQLDELFGGEPRAQDRERRERTPGSHEQGEERQEDEEAKAAPPAPVERVESEDEADRLIEKAAQTPKPHRGIDRSKATKRPKPSAGTRVPKPRPRASVRTLAGS